MRRTSFTSAVAALVGAGIASIAPLAVPAAAQELYLTGGRVIDPATRQIRAQNLLIRDGRIAGSPAEAPDGFAGETLDITGQWVIPALVDLHTHSFGNQAPVQGAMEFPGTIIISHRMLYAGVGAFLDLFSPEDQIFFIRNAQRENQTPGADIFAAGPCMTAPEGHCSEYGIPTRLMSTPEEATRQVDELAPRAPDVIKLVYSQGGRLPSVDRATMTAVVTAARRHGIKTIIHIGSWEDVRHVAIAGATAITHVPVDEVVPDDVIDLMVEHGVASIPTLAVQLGVSDLTAHPEYLDAPLARAVASEAVLAAYRSDELMPAAVRWRERQIEEKPRVLESVRRMHEAGIPIFVGTDSGNLGTIQGWSVHHELMKLVEAGLEEWEALASGSVEAAAFLGQSYGVEEGDAANLVVLEASPIEDIRNTQRVVHVIHRGRLMNREALIAP